MKKMTSKRHDNERHLFSGTMKMADLLDINFQLMGVLSRVGIPFGFGDDSVEDACQKYGVSTNTFLLICNVYTYDGYIPSAETLRNIDVKDIVTYLRQSHSYYMGVLMDLLEGAIERMVQPCTDKYKAIIRNFFLQYKEELAKHFEYEEKEVFPYVESVLNHSAGDDFKIYQYEENHSNVEEKLCDLKNIVMKYMPKECDSQKVYHVLLYIFSLEKDLEKHTSIENDILVPVVNRLEEHEK